MAAALDSSLTGLGGWAEKLFREANASAFVGAWEVHDDLAVEFTKHFYERLAAGDARARPCGRALHLRNRRHQPDLAGLHALRRPEHSGADWKQYENRPRI